MIKTKKTEGQQSLTSSLLPSADDGKTSTSSRSRSSSSTRNHSEMYHTYANNAPKIMLETINGRTITIVFVVTYVIAFASFGFDLSNTIIGFEDGNRILPSTPCSALGINPYSPPDKNSYGCSFQEMTPSGTQQFWMGRANEFKNVISWSLQLMYENITGIYYNDTVITEDDMINDISVAFNVKLYCCYENSGCGDILANGTSSAGSQWRKVIDTDNDIELSGYEIGDSVFEPTILENTFQNQETLPDQGIIRSYHMYVTYDPGESVNAYIEGDSRYSFKNTNVQEHLYARVLLNILFVVSCAITFLYYRALKSTYGDVRNLALPEQRWQLFYMIAVILFQNPFYCVIMWITDPPVTITYMTYVIDAIAQASFLTVWLLFSDGLRRNFQYWMFYIPKVFMGAFIALTACVILTLQFPSINKYDDRSPVLAVEEWSYDLKISLVSFSLTFLFAFWAWAFWWFYSLWNTGRQLQNLPYMGTRYLQLWFRFFFIQSILSSLYLIAQYAATIYFIFSNSAPSADSSLENVADNINTLFRQQTLAFGKVLFISVNSFILAFFLLPAGYFDKYDYDAVTNLAATYVVNESEIGPIYRSRKRAIRRLRLMNELFINNPKAHVFCIDLAAELMELSWEAYNDVPGFPTVSGYGVINFDRVNYKLVNHAYDEQHDTVCYIVRHKVLPRVVICFRGTSSKQHWADNLNYSQRPIDLMALRIPDLDRVDGLGSRGQTGDIYGRLRESGGEDSVFTNLAKLSDDGSQDSDKEVDITFNFSESLSDCMDPVDRESSHSDSSGASTETEFSEHYDDEQQSRPPSLKRTVSGMYDRAGKTITATTDIITSAVKSAPIINQRFETSVHTGFWDAYMTVRDFIHTTLRQELAQRPANVVFTGHSLGGALATLACLDVSIHTIPRVNTHISYLQSAKKNEADIANHRKCEVRDSKVKLHRYIKSTIYTFGSPRIGNNAFAKMVNKRVPDYFRVTVDGDVVTAVPKGGLFKHHYKHAGTEIVIDAIGSGSIIVDPSFIERTLRTHSKTSLSAHALGSYRKGLNGVKAAAEYMRSVEIADGTQPQNCIDPAFVQRQVVIAKASAKAARVSISQLAQEMQEFHDSEKDDNQDELEVEREIKKRNISDGTFSQNYSPPRPLSYSKHDKDYESQDVPASMFRSANNSRTKSTEEIADLHARDMDALVQSMSERQTSIGASLARTLSDIATGKRRNDSNDYVGGRLESEKQPATSLQPSAFSQSRVNNSMESATTPTSSHKTAHEPRTTVSKLSESSGRRDDTIVTIDLINDNAEEV